MLALAIFSGSFALAKLVPDCSGAGCGWSDLIQLAINVINFIVKIVVPPVAGLLIVWGGIILLTSGGNEQRVGEGKKIITNVVIGLIIVYTSWLVVNTLLNVLTNYVVNLK